MADASSLCCSGVLTEWDAPVESVRSDWATGWRLQAGLV